METFEFLDRAGDGSDEVTNVELCDLNAGIFSAVLQGEFDLDRVGGGIFTAVESYVGIFKEPPTPPPASLSDSLSDSLESISFSGK